MISKQSISRAGRSVGATCVIALLATTSAMAGTDMRSPDARDGASRAAVTPSLVSNDLRSPDARDATRPRQPVVVALRPVTATPSAGSFEWGDAAIGAVIAVALMAIASAAFRLLGRRRLHAHRAAAIS